MNNEQSLSQAIVILIRAFNETRIQDVEATRMVNSAIGYVRRQLTAERKARWA